MEFCRKCVAIMEVKGEKRNFLGKTKALTLFYRYEWGNIFAENMERELAERLRILENDFPECWPFPEIFIDEKCSKLFRELEGIDKLQEAKLISFTHSDIVGIELVGIDICMKYMNAEQWRQAFGSERINLQK